MHHLYCNYVADLFDRLFIYDSYSCRKGKGTLFGIERLEHHIRSATHNFTRPAYILQLDIQGYFMHIRRDLLHNIVTETLQHYGYTDPLLLFLTDVIILKDPLQHCRYCGNPTDWDGLPDSKCLSKQPEGVGLPIGDLTSQLFSNIFLNRLDRFVQFDLGFKHYGRYVDDFWLIDTDKERLCEAIEPIRQFLSEIGMVLHPKKIRLHPCTDKVSFLGAVCAPYYRHASKRTTKKFRRKLREWEKEIANLHSITDKRERQQRLNDCRACVNSYLGYLGHFKADGLVSEHLFHSFLLNAYKIEATDNVRWGKLCCLTITHPIPKAYQGYTKDW